MTRLVHRCVSVVSALIVLCRHVLEVTGKFARPRKS